MHTHLKQLIPAHLSLLAVLALTISGTAYQKKQAELRLTSSNHTLYSASIGSVESMKHMERYESYPDSMTWRIARRLRNRIRKRQLTGPMLSRSAKAVAHRQWLLKRSATVSFTYPDNEDRSIPAPSSDSVWNVSISEHPEWIRAHISPVDIEFSISEYRIRSYLESQGIPGVLAPQDAVLTSIEMDEDELYRAETEITAKPGFVTDLHQGSKAIVDTLMSDDSSELSLPLTQEPGKIINELGEDLGDLELLSTGRSNFAGSTWGRRFNVRKAFHEHVHNTVVMPGAEFSFNATLGGPVTLSNGWSKAKVIFAGEELRPAPGGGICQASTTVYRAGLEAGLPVSDRRSHSLFVTYYERHGVGIDATIFPGTQDLTFTNDTGYPILIQAYTTSNDDAYVNIYGTSDGRSVALDGPYFRSTAPSELEDVRGTGIAKNEIAWLQTVTDRDGNAEKFVITSRYKDIPEYIRNRYSKQLLSAAESETTQ